MPGRIVMTLLRRRAVAMVAASVLAWSAVAMSGVTMCAMTMSGVVPLFAVHV
jgi:hypothetical protein